MYCHRFLTDKKSPHHSFVSDFKSTQLSFIPNHHRSMNDYVSLCVCFKFKRSKEQDHRTWFKAENIFFPREKGRIFFMILKPHHWVHVKWEKWKSWKIKTEWALRLRTSKNNKLKQKNREYRIWMMRSVSQNKEKGSIRFPTITKHTYSRVHWYTPSGIFECVKKKKKKETILI